MPNHAPAHKEAQAMTHDARTNRGARLEDVWREGSNSFGTIPALEADIHDFLCRRYVQHADERQREMGLQYTKAEARDLARSIAAFVVGTESSDA